MCYHKSFEKEKVWSNLYRFLTFSIGSIYCVGFESKWLKIFKAYKKDKYLLDIYKKRNAFCIDQNENNAGKSVETV